MKRMTLFSLLFVVSPVLLLLTIAVTRGDKKFQGTFALTDTVALGLTCDSKADPSSLEFQITSPVVARDIVTSLISCATDDVVLSSFPDVYIWFKDKHDLFHKGYLHTSLKKISFFTGRRAESYSVPQKELDLLLAAKPADCKK